jgi:hypothetical protein
MATITLRSIKGSPLTITEMDSNFSNINLELGTKLDTTNYTAADILTKIKTVDGAGSGLDADLLDGFSSSTSSTANTIALRDNSGRITATTFTGNVTGNVTGNLTGNVTGNITGNVTSTSVSISGGSATGLSNLTTTNFTASGTTTLSGTNNLTGTTTAVTQSAADNSTKVATTAYVDAATGTLGTMSTQNASNVTITGGSITGLTALSTASGTISATTLSASTVTASTTLNIGVNWSAVQSGTDIVFKYNGVNKMKVDSSGNLTVTGNVTAYGTV